MKTIIFTLLCLASVIPSIAAQKQISPQEREKLIQEKLGGFIEIEAKGSIVIVNCQEYFSLDGITNVIALTRKNLQTRVDIVEGKFSVSTASREVAKHDATAGIFIVDDDSLPLSLISLEELWGVVNIAKLRDGATPEILAKRASKEYNRVLSAVFGGGLSKQKSSIARPMTKLADLDKTVNVWIPFDTLGTIFNALPDYGISPKKRIPYRKAVQEGWAPAPTNEFQQAIWDKVHAIPANPIKIEFDPKKGR